MNQPITPELQAQLSQLLPEDADLGAFLENGDAPLLEPHWQELQKLGFDLVLGRDALEVRHRDRGFEMVIQLSVPEDLGELRSLFLGLRRHFGRLRERWLPWLFVPGRAVTAPYQHLRSFITGCQALRHAAGPGAC